MVKRSVVAGLAIAAWLAVPVVAMAQSQVGKTGAGGAAAGADATELLSNPLLIGTLVAVAIGVALAVTSADNSGLSTSTSTSTSTIAPTATQ